MSTTSAPTLGMNSPALSDLVEEPILSKPISKWAIAAMILGFLGILGTISYSLVFLSVLAVLVGGGTVIYLLFISKEFTGLWMAQLGLLMGLICSVCSFSTRYAERKALAEQATQYANIFLQTVSKGDVYAATELLIPPIERQLPSVDLKEFYEYAAKNISPIINPFSPPDYHTVVGNRYVAMRDHEVTAFLLKHPEAQWELFKLDSVIDLPDSNQLVTIFLENIQNRSERLSISLNRNLRIEEDGHKARWHVKGFMLK